MFGVPEYRGVLLSTRTYSSWNKWALLTCNTLDSPPFGRLILLEEQTLLPKGLTNRRIVDSTKIYIGSKMFWLRQVNDGAVLADLAVVHLKTFSNLLLL